MSTPVQIEDTLRVFRRLLRELGKPTEPDKPLEAPAEEQEAVQAPQEPPAFEPPSPDSARRSLGDLGVQYNQRSFIEAAGAGDLNVVQLFVWAGMDVNVQPYTASVVYIPERDNPTRVAHLKYSWFPQEGQEDDDTALMKAAGNGHIDVVKFLCENGVDLCIRNQQKQTAMYFAAAGGYLEIVKYLHAQGRAKG